MTDITYKNDSVYIKLPVFEGFIAAKIEKEQLKGHFIKPDLIELEYKKKMDKRFVYKIAMDETDTFLIPVNKVELFNYRYSENIHWLKDTVYLSSKQERITKLNIFNNVCFIKLSSNKK